MTNTHVAPEGTVGADPGTGAPPRDRTPWFAAVGGVVAAVLVFLVVHRALPDDGYITLTYARNLAEQGHWGLIADLTANTATSPLNVWLLAAGILVTGRPVVAVGLVLAAALAATGWWAAGLARELQVSPALPAVVVTLLATSPLLTSTVGLESYLVGAVTVGLTRYAVTGRALACGAVGGLAVLVRPDLAVAAAVTVVGLVAARRWLLVAAVAAAVSVPWHLFAWLELGGFVPDTVLFKTDGAPFPGPTGGAGMVTSLVVHYGPGMAAAVAVTVATIATGWLVAPLGGRTAVVAALAGVAHWVALAAIGATPYLWYYAPLLTGSVLALGIAAGRRPAAVAPAAVLAVAAVSLWFVRPVPWTDAPMFSNGGTAGQYVAAGVEVGRIVGSGTVSSPGEIGALAFACRCRILDQFSDPARAQVLVARSLESSVGRLNAAHRASPAPPRPTDYRLGYAGEVPDEALGAWPVGISSTPQWLVLVRG